MPNDNIKTNKAPEKASRLSESMSFRVGGTSYTASSLQTAAERKQQTASNIKTQTDGYYVKPSVRPEVSGNVAVGNKAPSAENSLASTLKTGIPSTQTNSPSLMVSHSSQDAYRSSYPSSVPPTTVSPTPIHTAQATNTLHTTSDRVQHAVSGIKTHAEGNFVKSETNSGSSNNFTAGNGTPSGTKSIATAVTSGEKSAAQIKTGITVITGTNPTVKLQNGTNALTASERYRSQQNRSNFSSLSLDRAKPVPFAQYQGISIDAGSHEDATANETEIPLTSEQLAGAKQYYQKMGATQNVTTQSIQHSENMIRTAAVVTGTDAKSEDKAEDEFKKKITERRHHIVEAKCRVSDVVCVDVSRKKDGRLHLTQKVYTTVERQFEEQDDVGARSVGMVMASGTAALHVFRAAQKTVVVVRNTADAIKTGTIVIKTFSHASQMRKLAGAVPVKLRYQNLKWAAKTAGLNTTRLGNRIVSRIKHYENLLHKTTTTFKNVYGGIKTTAVTLVNGYHKVKTAISIIRGIRAGGMGLTAAHIQLLRNSVFRGTRQGVIRTLKSVGKAVGKGTLAVGKAAGKVAFKSGRLLGKGGIGLANSVAGSMMATDDVGLKSVGYAYTAARLGLKVGIKTGTVGFKATKTGVKTAVKGGKAIVRGIRYFRRNGFKATLRRVGKGIGKGLVQAGKSVVSAALNLVKAVAAKLIVPILIIIAACAAFMAVAGAVSSVGTIFGGVFTDKDTGTEMEVASYLQSVVPVLVSDKQNALYGEVTNAMGDYEIVRLPSSASDTGWGEATLENLASTFPDSTTLVNMLGPMLNAVILQRFELEPTMEQARALTEEMVMDLFALHKEEEIEYCGQVLKTGEGSALEKCGKCDKIHAIVEGENACPNCEKGAHKEYSGDTCCTLVYNCKGHGGVLVCGKKVHVHQAGICFRPEDQMLYCSETEHQHSSACYSTPNHGTGNSSAPFGCDNYETVHTCSGYAYCKGHRVAKFSLVMSITGLENEYFREPMEEAQDDPKKLSELKDYYEIYEEMKSLFVVTFDGNIAGSISLSELATVEFYQSPDRKGNYNVTNLAKSQVGQVGGHPYWSYLGFGGRVEWCACFVHWVMRNTPSATALYPTAESPASCTSIRNKFRSLDRFERNTYRNLVAGDVILFDWDLNGDPNHIGIVLGRDNEWVYTVEGNSGDAVKIIKYPLNDPEIHGYCRMDY